MLLWDQWKKGFDTWEQKTADLFEAVLKRPAVLQPMGALLSAGMRARARLDDAQAQVVSALGLPTRREQEKTLHALNQITSRLLDLEERLAQLQQRD